MKIQKLLIANRGEIARRIQKTAQKLGINTASICSELDVQALFAREAQELLIIGPAAPKDSYLAIDKIIKAAKSSGCNAVHPGYGFLSENADFAQAVIDAGLIFIGPNPKSIRMLGSKTEAKKIARKANVNCAPNSLGGLSDQELITAAKDIGFPLLIKAVAGGGGRGMRLVSSDRELSDSLQRARGEAQKFFSSSDIYLEKYIERPRHVEVQLMGDQHGGLIHLGTRDCSTQRRHQKIIEEAPAPQLSSELREKLHTAALNIGKAVGYYSAGTVEFLVKGEDLYFLEVNTRIQVEHPVTEAITGLDLIELQIRVANGEKLPLTQSEVRFQGHAIEFRICAEDPSQNFSPSGGLITNWEKGHQDLYREDFGFEKGDTVSLQYDSLISKVIVHSKDRAECIDKSLMVLNSYRLEGPFCTIALQRWFLYNRWFRSGPVDIGYVEREFSVSKLEELEVAERRDPLWIQPVYGAFVKNEYQYKSEKYKTTYTIEILHKHDGFFVAVPVDSSGRRGKTTNCRMSNGLSTVMKSLINDVLETKPPSEIFA